MSEYDRIAKKYKADVLKGFLRKYSYNPSFLELIGDLKNKSVIDFACGEGTITRLIKQKGAKEVIGIDVSEKMINLAKHEEKKSPLKIKYHVYNAANVPKLRKFDLATGLFFLHYASTKKELLNFLKSVSRNLKRGGKFITLNCTNNLMPENKYGIIRSGKRPIKEGNKIKITLFDDSGKKLCSFDNYYWSKEIYCDYLKKAGFDKIRWHYPKITDDGIIKFGKAFWDDYLQNPINIFLEATKTK